MYPTASKDPRGGHNRSQVNQNFFQSWSPQMAYVLGFILADGAIEDVQKSSRTCYTSMVSKDLSILNKIRQAMGSYHNIYKRIPKLLTFPNGKQYLPSIIFYLRIGSKLMYNDLLTLGVTPRKSLTISFPSILQEYLPFLVRGYFDGDGCIYMIKGKYPRIVFTSGSIKFLEGLARNLGKALKIPLKSIYLTHTNTINPCYQLQYNTTRSRVILEFMYKDLEKAPYLDRKFAIYQKYLQSLN